MKARPGAAYSQDAMPMTAMVEPGKVVAQTASEDLEIGLRGVASLRALRALLEPPCSRRLAADDEEAQVLLVAADKTG